MKKYEYVVTGLIADTFEEQNIRFHVSKTETGYEVIEAGFPVKNGPLALVRFITKGDNDISIRLYSLINGVTERKARMLEACNMINNAYRFLRLVIDKDDDVTVEYDIPMATSDDCVGQVCADIFRGFATMMNDVYPFLMKALHTDEELVFEKESRRTQVIDAMRELLAEAGEEVSDDESPDELLQRLRAVRQRLQAQVDENDGE